MNSKSIGLAFLLTGLLHASAASTPFIPLTFTDSDPNVQHPSGLVEFHSINGVLNIDMAAVYDATNPNGADFPLDPEIPDDEQVPFPRLAYSCKYTGDTTAPVVSYAGPLLRVFPGDRVIIHFKNLLHTERTNLHFHGMSVSPRKGTKDGKGYGDYVNLPFVNQIDPGTEREYNFIVPKEQRPGLFWYHAHAHGVAENQVGCGLGGPIFIEGQIPQFLSNWTTKVQQLATPEVAAKLIPTVTTALPKLTQQILVLKDFEEPGAEAIQGPFEQSVNGKVTYSSKTKVASPYWITSDGSKQVWSISNESADLYYMLIFHTSKGDQPFEVISRDGGPDDFSGPGMGTAESPLMIPPAGRVTVIAPTDTVGNTVGCVIAQPVNTNLGAMAAYKATNGDQYFQRFNPKNPDPGNRTTPWKIIEIHPLKASSALATAMPSLLNFPVKPDAVKTAPLTAPVDATYVFSQPGLYVNEPKLLPYEANQNLTFYKYLPPKDWTDEVKNPLDIYEPYEPPIATLVPGVPQRWVIQNSTQEWHVFHIHQIQFKVDYFTVINRPYDLKADPLLSVTRPTHNYQHPFYSDDLPPPPGLKNGDPEYAGLQDTVSIPPLMQAWITLPMTEGTHRNDPIAGQFVMHCHILGHEDAGMMANVQATYANGVMVTETKDSPQATTSFLHSLAPIELASVRRDRPLRLENAVGQIESEKVFTQSDYSLVTFGFTHCDGTCPSTMEKCLSVLGKLPAADQARIKPYFLSLDPKRDRGTALTEYAAMHELPSAWNLLVDTDLAGIRAFGVQRKIKASPEGKPQIWHTSTVYVIDRDLKIRAAFDPEVPGTVMTERLHQLLSGEAEVPAAKAAVTEKKAPRPMLTGVELTMDAR